MYMYICTSILSKIYTYRMLLSCIHVQCHSVVSTYVHVRIAKGILYMYVTFMHTAHNGREETAVPEPLNVEGCHKCTKEQDH